jgi:hypothetical protein
MDYFEAVQRRRHVKDREAEGMVADNMDVRLAIVERIKSGEITLEQGQSELRAIKRNAKASGMVTRDQAFREGE